MGRTPDGCHAYTILSSSLPGIFAVLGCGFAVRRLSLLHPAVLWTGSWAFSAVLYSLHLLPYRNLSWLTAGLICGAVVVFAGGSSLGARIRPRRIQPEAGRQAEAIELAAWVLVALLVVTVAAFMAQLVSRFGVSQVLRISPTVKLYLAGGEAPLSTVYVEVAIAAATVCALAAATVSRPARKRLWLIASVSSAASVYFSTSRAFIVFSLIAALAAFLLTSARVNRGWLAIGAVGGAALVLVLFTGLGAILGKTYGNSTIGEFDNFFSRHPIARPLALPYEDATASIPALDLLTGVSSTWGVAHGCATVPIVCGVLRKVGVPALRVPVTGTFTQAPLPWNGYTFLERLLTDFGTGLMLPFLGFTGALAGYLWSRARRGSVGSIIVYAISVPALVAAYRQNLFEIVLVASVIAAGLFWLCKVALERGLARSDVPGLSRVNAVLGRLLVAPSERLAVLGPATEHPAPTAGVRGPELGAFGRVGAALRAHPWDRVRLFQDVRSRGRANRHSARRLVERRPVRRGRAASRGSAVEPPERLDVAGRTPKTKEEWEHYARYVWASQLARGIVLDIACGTGYGARLLARSARVIGIDRDEAAVDLARSRARGSFLVAEVPPIPTEAQTFNFVVCFETIEHIDDDLEFMREIARVLRPRGLLLISTPNAEVSSQPGAPVNPWHVREHTSASLVALVESAGLVVRERRMQSFPPMFPRGHRLAWRMHALTLLLPRGLRVVTRPVFGDAEVRPYKDRSRAPGYWLVIAEKPLPVRRRTATVRSSR